MIAAFTAAQKRDLNFLVVGLSVPEYYEVPLVFLTADAEPSAATLFVFLSWLAFVLASMSSFSRHESYKFSDVIDVGI